MQFQIGVEETNWINKKKIKKDNLPIRRGMNNRGLSEQDWQDEKSANWHVRYRDRCKTLRINRTLEKKFDKLFVKFYFNR